jgi:hypothetical protein
MNSDEPGGELPPMTWANASHPLLPQGAPPVQGCTPARANRLEPFEESSRPT